MNRLKRLTIIQYVICGLLLIFILSILLSGHTKDITRETARQAIVQAEGIDALKEGYARDMKKNLGLDEADFDWVIYYTGNGLMDVSELLIVRADTSEALETAESCVTSRIEEQTINFDGYGTNQIDLLGHAISKKVGSYYFYAVSEHASSWEEVFMDLVK